MLEEKKLFYIARRNLFDKLVNILFKSDLRGGSERRGSENIRRLSGGISEKLPAKTWRNQRENFKWFGMNPDEAPVLISEANQKSSKQKVKVVQHFVMALTEHVQWRQ